MSVLRYTPPPQTQRDEWYYRIKDSFRDLTGRVRSKTEEFCTAMVNNGRVDAVRSVKEESRKKAERLVDVDTVSHTDAREIGAEWICLHAIRELGIDRFLERKGWNVT